VPVGRNNNLNDTQQKLWSFSLDNVCCLPVSGGPESARPFFFSHFLGVSQFE